MSPPPPPHNMSCVTCHVSHVTCHVSHVTCHMSCVTYNFFFLFFSFWTKRWSLSWRVFYQWGLTRLVYKGTADQNWFSTAVFERSSGCTLQFTSTELLPLHNFQNWDCHCMWAYSFGIEEIWWVSSSTSILLPGTGEDKSLGTKRLPLR